MRVNLGHLLKQPMGESVAYKVAEDPIDPRGDNADLLDADIRAIDADVKATHTNPGAYLQGDARARVSQQCVRCLRPIESEVEATFAEQYYATLTVDSGAPMREPPPDSKTIGPDFNVDLTPLLREEVILATPQAPLCRPDCRGLCQVCGKDLNESPHDHEAPADDRWAALRGFKAGDG
ncbi:MAG: DUF177 domain-containing protein [Chloroflexi bacterium]|nr:DUF177 domain-containing protein [Chloroflexota bacterium]